METQTPRAPEVKPCETKGHTATHRYRVEKRLVFWLFGTNKTKKDVILKNEPEKLLKTQEQVQKTNRNEPKNEAEKLLKTRGCGKNEPETNRKTKRAMLLKINGRQKSKRMRGDESKSLWLAYGLQLAAVFYVPSYALPRTFSSTCQ